MNAIGSSMNNLPSLGTRMRVIGEARKWQVGWVIGYNGKVKDFPTSKYVDSVTLAFKDGGTRTFSILDLCDEDYCRLEFNSVV